MLTDRAWLAHFYNLYGDQWVADHIGCNRKTVIAARQRHGISSMPRGPRRGITPDTDSRPVVKQVAQLLENRREPASWHGALRCIADADTARKACDQPAERDAAIQLAVTALRVAEQLDQAA